MASSFPEGIVPDPSVNLGGGTLTAGTNGLQESIDALNRSVSTLNSNLTSQPGNFRQNGPYVGGNWGGGNTGTGGRFPSMFNPFGTNNYAPGIGGGGPGGTGNISQPQPFYQSATLAGAGMIIGAGFQYGQNQLSTQLGLNAYVTQSQLGLNGGYYSNQLMTQAFGMYNRNLNNIASSPMDALAMAQQLQFLGGNPLYMRTGLGRAGFGATAAFGLTNPTLSGAQSASLAQQIFSPQFSQQMIALGYGTSPRTLGGGPVSGIGNIMQAILRGWYNKNSVSPSQLYSTLAQGGRGYANLQALGLNPNQVSPLLLGYNQLFQQGVSPSQATSLFEQGAKGGAAGQAARQTLARYHVTTATSDIQAIKNAQAVVTGRASDVAGGFNRGIADATGLLIKFNTALTNILTNTGLNGPLGFMGGFGSILSGTNHGPGLLGIGGLALLLRGLGLGGGAGGAAGAAGGLGGALSGLSGALGPLAIGAAGFFGLRTLQNKALSGDPAGRSILSAQQHTATGTTATPVGTGIIDWIIQHLFSGSGSGSGSGLPSSGNGVITRFAQGGIIPGYQPGLDRIPAMLSRGEAILNPGAARALGHGRINMLNALHKPAGSDTSLRNGTLYASGGFGSGGAKPGGNITGYANPMRGVHNLTPERIDMGVDYAGTGPVYAIGPGVVTNNNTSWAGAQGAPYPGYFISYRLTAGPDAGKYVYVAEDIWPSVKVGQKVTSSTVIGNMRGGIETGWAAPPGTGNTMAAVSGQASSSGDPGSVMTAYGVSFSNLLSVLGAPPGLRNGRVSGTAPSPFGTGGSSGTTQNMGGTGMTSSSGIGFSESSLIPNISELSALSGGFGGGGGTTLSSSGNPMTGTGSKPASNGGFGNVSGLGGTRAQNKALMMKLAAKYGWGSGPMWSALNSLVMSESGYDNHAQNPTSTAYGIGQFLDSTWAGFGPKTSNPRLQEIYMLEYIKQRYRNPEKAWAFHVANNWYGTGGTPPAGSMGIVGDRGPELVSFGEGGGVLSNSRTASMLRGNSALPAQSPWTTGTGTSILNSAMTGIGTPHISIVFNQGSIVIHGSGDSRSDASKAGREVARQIIQRIQSESIYAAIAEGNKY